MRPRTFLVVVKHNAMKNPVKQNFVVKNELFYELNDIKSCYIGRERALLLFCFFVSVLLGVLLLLFLVFFFAEMPVMYSLDTCACSFSFRRSEH